MGRIGKTTNDDGTIEIATEERHEHFHTHAGNELKSPALTGPILRHAHPARRAIQIRFGIPMKLYSNASELVGMNFLSSRTRDGCRFHDLPDEARGTFGA